MTQIINEVKKIIPDENYKYYGGFMDNKYFFKYDNCGRVNNKIVDYFTVVSFIYSEKLITVYPCVYGENYNYIDLNYLKQVDVKQKKKSQIDKFNQKYGIK